ncbi:MAG: 30S ribosomal protein S4 [Candidatus Yanofskybacteria bacterium RIFCSPHIGHO2_01_FULL_45_42]|uniref:Small ribosomal subunit protein uS4 n=3 Tax=Candidatus Yanofskyibacteriota TaxID=1752733 RepID=A0A1F8H442_9BACT|nr:MAG: 30S ribosomal protein S4 [Candidatus Yanofskybacteria bacterium RIFCSPHIGHO2_01_FULL_45_42]OGN16887.1 MAG: 30S ribosomal protein S4 [Candidatus Yanofskybacteria bacterium RIFCSPHIGHO2_02_FULL_46_19]OGN27575.1 MAG: 30S ribosomal protein S4 [Candidatus Yanofskybacteria bacterium RIFCSPLOWO2_01_FULL_45_72]OGN32040.1 MAG: 30S ribosomal protein S4 [Candidatus Yanofskybacteria bacterium RIFCSPLOWO2_02_FULL_45_18]
MARYTGPKDKIERRLGEKLFLKGERSHSQKSSVLKKPYPPGMHGHNRRGRISEFGTQLQSKQKVRNTYRMLEKQFKNLVKKALDTKEEPYSAISRRLEQRLDNVVFRLGFAQSRDQARQLVNHGHITVNGKKVDIASYETRVGDVVNVRENDKKSSYFSSLVPQWLKNYDAPEWLELNKGALSGKIKKQPMPENGGLRPDDLQAIIEFYSR